VSEEARRTLRYVEPLSDARTPLADFFSILLEEADGDAASIAKTLGDIARAKGMAQVA
jgi:DNA-binding phage protein